jgi:hypothetical protein
VARADFNYSGNRVSGRGLQQIAGRLNGGVKRDLDRRARLVKAEAERLVGVDSGRLKRTIRIERGPGFVEVVAGRPGKTPYLGWHMAGTPPHVIRVRRRKALRWYVNGQPRFATKVMHPGTRPNDFLRNALRAARG